MMHKKGGLQKSLPNCQSQQKKASKYHASLSEFLHSATANRGCEDFVARFCTCVHHAPSVQLSSTLNEQYIEQFFGYLKHDAREGETLDM